MAVLCHEGFLKDHAYFEAALKKHELETRPYWLQLAQLDGPLAASGAVQLLMHSRAAEAFDALLITDENLVEHATSGLLATGVRVPQDVEIVAHCNFPLLAPAALPAQRLGYDAREVMATCIDLIDRARAGQKTPALTPIAARFEDEI